jgi:hypothetical protein
MLHVPFKTRHDFHLAKTGSMYKLYERNKHELPEGYRWYKGVTSMIINVIDKSDTWISEDNALYTPLNDKPVRTIIRKGSGKEIIAIFTSEPVYDEKNKRNVEIWSSVRGFMVARPSAMFAQTEDYEGNDFKYWADHIAKIIGRVVKTVKDL